MEFVEISILGNKKAECLDFEAGRKLNLKINELVDAVNDIQKEREAERFEIQEWIGILEAVRKSVNIHEKQIDELQMKLEPKKCETRAENVQPDTESRQENVQKETFVSIDEALNTATAKELARTRKALDIAINVLNRVKDVKYEEYIDEKLEQIESITKGGKDE